MGSGLGLGLLVALAVYLHGAPPAAPSMPAPAPAPAAPEAAPPADPAPGAAARAAPAARFDFYEVLPQFEVVVPEGDSAPRAARAVRAVEEPGRYVLQAGSFKFLGDADRRQAQLALLGIESRIESVTLGDGTYHRVRIGPMDDAELNRIRGRLHAARVESLLLQAPE